MIMRDGPMKNVINNACSTTRRPFNKITAANNNNFTKKVNTVKGTRVNTTRPKAVLSAVNGNKGNAVKASACWVWHMIGNKSYLTYYEEIDGGFVAFGGNSKDEKIFRKDFKLTDESDILLKVPRKDNMYSVDLKNVIPQGGFTCLFVKATSDEFNLWHRRLGHVNFKTMNKMHRRLGHINFKTMNKLVKGNLVRAVLLVKRESNIELLKVTEEPGKEGGDSSKEDECNDQEKDDNVNSTNNVNAASTNEVNVVGRKSSIELPDDLNIPELEDIVYLDDDEDVGTEADMNNLDAFMLVWTLVDLPNSKRAIGTKWVYKNKKNERGIVIKNEARLVTQGYTQEEGIDYDEAFSLVARIEAIRLFLAYALFKDFVVYQIDFKSAFLYSKIEEEVYVYQPPEFVDSDFLDRVYKVEKALYRLHQAPRAWYETLSTYLLDNGFQRGKIDMTFFIRRDKGDTLLVQVYVDDIIFGFTKKSLCTKFEKMMHKKFQMSSMGELIFFLGLQVKQKEDGILISQDKYLHGVLQRIKKDEIGIVIKNKARLVAQGYTQEEWIDYDDVFALVAKIVKLGLFCLCLHLKDLWCTRGCQVLFLYDDIIFGSTKKELCNAFEKLMHKKFQMSSIGELTFFLGLQVKQKNDGIFIRQDKYVAEI
ncbi:putative ribonuclease H-like domain-containing protein [Tanacetum coccineum]|uniref:Ribonuclease H-like domain-containing protein n=1 Tax=Tanacetum coccineum TaxID=301880 RepID=A0ABQ4XGZ0_9ASTR